MEGNMCVIDCGTHTFKAGYAYNFPSEEEPRVQIPLDTFKLNGSSPSSVEKGGIKELEALLRHTLYDRLGWIDGYEGCVVVAEPVLTSRSERENLTQLMFEKFNVNGLYVQDQAVLSLYGVGKVSGCVIDIGHDKTDVSAVLEGQTCQSTVRRIPLGGRHVTERLSQLLEQRGVKVSNSVKSVEVLKEMCAHAADSEEHYENVMRGAIEKDASTTAAVSTSFPADPAASDAQPTSLTGSPVTYTLPDGTQIIVGNEGCCAVETLLRPGVTATACQRPPSDSAMLPDQGQGGRVSAGIEAGHIPGIPETVISCVETGYEGNLRRAALENLLVCGGGSCIPNLSQRLLREIRGLSSPPSITPALCPIPEYLPPSTSRSAAWLGGAVVARVVLNQSGFVTKWDYEEAGPQAVHRRCS
ncbi:hypothetical protein CEUSTIGMA_g4551.t1 [Chlamydomonas eustigma]|uniref:Uncharacterized protein n=1 Tax=Chlamydomonas eustigma TaxID=1157962 RepID=A0A250X226_9CHLO|nr:hypothetical protein CEUSTIGMA_g4551.t1 [Chlamydomonas eustigma]|eukprot:GAX77105.1 hypothetical protein CEUSTIGMA_g4551.t1 [Chlamydomonas eustigma]